MKTQLIAYHLFAAISLYLVSAEMAKAGAAVSKSERGIINRPIAIASLVLALLAMLVALGLAVAGTIEAIQALF